MSKETLDNARWLIGAIARSLHMTRDPAALEVLSRLAAQDLDPKSFTPQPSTRLPVVRHFADTVGEAMLVSPDLAAALAAIDDQLHWRQTVAYSDALLGEGFMANYGWCQLIGPYGYFSGADFLLGLLLIGPGQHYRDHFHPAPELYFPLTGGTAWRRQDTAFETREAGTAIWHAPREIHATRTALKPLLAVWCWTQDVATPATLA
jgi:hypothetical protein